ncbi:MAG: hypothetical protein P1V51_19675 [Deltaproteobacteria bacterium]|nr:hypothetical protein [Deltaproteobacteria bacterium]
MKTHLVLNRRNLTTACGAEIRRLPRNVDYSLDPVFVNCPHCKANARRQEQEGAR